MEKYVKSGEINIDEIVRKIENLEKKVEALEERVEYTRREFRSQIEKLQGWVR